MTTAEIEDVFDMPQTCNPSSCGECWRTFGTRKECQVIGTPRWEERRQRVENAASAMAEAKYMHRRALGKQLVTQDA